MSDKVRRRFQIYTAKRLPLQKQQTNTRALFSRSQGRLDTQMAPPLLSPGYNRMLTTVAIPIGHYIRPCAFHDPPCKHPGVAERGGEKRITDYFLQAWFPRSSGRSSRRCSAIACTTNSSIVLASSTRLLVLLLCHYWTKCN